MYRYRIEFLEIDDPTILSPELSGHYWKADTIKEINDRIKLHKLPKAIRIRQAVEGLEYTHIIEVQMKKYDNTSWQDCGYVYPVLKKVI